MKDGSSISNGQSNEGERNLRDPLDGCLPRSPNFFGQRGSNTSAFGHVWDMPTGSDDVRSSGWTGSGVSGPSRRILDPKRTFGRSGRSRLFASSHSWSGHKVLGSKPL